MLDQFAWTIAVVQPRVELNYVNILWTFNITSCFFFPLVINVVYASAMLGFLWDGVCLVTF
jgi:hypothetical protein